MRLWLQETRCQLNLFGVGACLHSSDSWDSRFSLELCAILQTQTKPKQRGLVGAIVLQAPCSRATFSFTLIQSVASSWFANRQDKKKKPFVPFVYVCCSSVCLCISTMQVGFRCRDANIDHLPSTFKFEGWSNTTAARFLVWARWFVRTQARWVFFLNLICSVPKYAGIVPETFFK